MKAEQYWVIDNKGTVIYRTESKLSAKTFARVFKQGCEVLAVGRVRY